MITVGDQEVAILSEIFHGFFDCRCAPPNIMDGLYDQALRCRIAKPEIYSRAAFPVGAAHTADFNIEAVAEIPVQTPLQIYDADLIFLSERPFQCAQ